MSTLSQILYASLAASWIVYGISVSSTVLIVSGVTDLCCALTMTYYTLKYSPTKIEYTDLSPILIFITT